jgi:glycosyltransferase involved in cell wall biosynthesis
MPRVLTVLPDFPFPPTTGLHLRQASNLELLHRVGCFSAVLFFTTEERDPPPVESTPMARICHEVCHGGRRFPLSRFAMSSIALRKLDFLARGAMEVPGKRYPFSLSYDHIGADRTVLDEARRMKADFVILPPILLHYADPLRKHGFSIIIDAPDIVSRLSRSFIQDGKNRVHRFALYANYLACRSQERLFLRLCSELWATSADEADEFRRLAPELRVLVIPNCLDEEKVKPSYSGNARIVGFIGTYSYTPNVAAALFLAEQVFPRVLEACPDSVLRIAGANMPADIVTKLKALPHVEVLGFVEDSGCFMEECAVLALPVFLRGGVPLKLVEAMARGKAIVATPELVQGVDVSEGESILLRRNPKDFASAVVSLLQDASLRRHLGERARAKFVTNFSISGAEAVLRDRSVLMESSTTRPVKIYNPNPPLKGLS